ncbi:MAG: ribbon-helix-helix protein, CopG family [Firmicutes bacterium]|nr:ribbon-helix-helix protein, CopG family [Bacillota bacterium]
MTDTKRIMIYVPEHLLVEMDTIVREERINRSEFVREAVRMYIIERRKQVLRERLIEGYQLMADLNLLLAEEGTEDESLEYYERQLAEAE